VFKFYTSFTKEIDDPEAAARDIIEQLKPKENALKNTIGLVQFYHEFAETGAYQAIVDALPFEVIGAVSTFLGTNGEYGDFSLSVTMLTSNDIRFSVRTLETDTESREHIFDAIEHLCKELSIDEEPKMVMSFVPFMRHFTGDDLVAIVNALPKPFPLFGTIAHNDPSKGETNLVVNSKKISTVMFAFVAFYGDFELKFRVTTSFAYVDDYSDVAEITEAEGPILKAVNGLPAVEYLRRQGIINDDNMITNSSMWVVPAILTHPNGTRVARAFLGVVERTNYLYSAGTLETGAKIKFAYLDGDKTLSSAVKLFEEICEAKDNGIIAYSCSARAWALGAKYFSEAQKIAECADEYRQRHDTPLNYCLSYSGGEICPIIDNCGKLVNVFHNYTLISCAFG
jgi:hypothetical protein